ncbi:helix-hairpin-helix domain-containing protein [Rubrivirga sp. S365]|uniref:Helix-hairpin-helix domain-containing protein n=1 Tax=Rubrivirga litoralis TaxID=3075598 RepID=A0ABU3BRF6_9BACT|nr:MULTISPECIES: helix-hairpin-helix domain-containing protein [unclassified Rubrivirga]MDT0631871.1 helix-hairpin-helix domain-containing protein [Rubrivirga sp. F394]MDT7857924.1 helix-hairpin-helix domain-containing protein [Rubrivirga sp. S365]
MRALALTALALTLPLAACESEEAVPDEVPALAGPAPAPPEPVADAVGQGGAVLLNLNTTAEEDFQQVPGVGERMAHEFEEYRPYVSIQEFRREIGKYVDEATVASYEPYVFVPVRPNESDAETLAQLPGVGPQEAEALAAGRPYASDAAFLDRYADVAPGADRERAALYLDGGS